MINYDSVCRRLEELLVELLGVGCEVPARINDQLNSARRMINIYRTTPSELDFVMRNSPLLQIAEVDLTAIAEEALGMESAEAWQRKIIAAYTEPSAGLAKPRAYVSGIPKTDHWVRIQTAEIPEEADMPSLLSQYGLNADEQTDATVIIRGEKENAKKFIGEIRQIITRRKQ